MSRKSFVLLIVGMVIYLLCSISSADVPHMINYQGKLTTASGGCLNDTVQMTFTIYADSFGTTSEWTEIQTEVVVKEGIFYVLLGAIDTIPSAVFDGNIKYLGVQVESDPEMRPLKPMVSVAYAYRAATVDGGGGPDPGWVDDGPIVRLQDSTDYVCIGTKDNPGYSKLFLSHDYHQLTLQENDAAADEKNWCIDADNGDFAIWAVNDAFGGWTNVMYVDRVGNAPEKVIFQGKFGMGDSDPDARLEVSAEGGADDLLMLSSNDDSDGDRFVVKNSGNVGIGADDPQYKLDIRGTAGIDVGSYSGDVPLTINVPSDQAALISRIAKGGSVINVVDNEGNVGIGTFSPQEKLDVAGTARMTGFEMPTGASNGYVLTSDGSGVGTWQPGGGGPSSGWVDDGDVVRLETSTDSVGIGTSNPGAPLQVGSGSHAPVLVNTSFQVDHDDATEHNIEIRNNSGATSWRINSTGSTTFGPLSAGQDLYLLGGNSTRMTIDGTSGDVGIGTTTPEARLHVVPGGSQALTIQRDGEIQMGIRAYGSTAYPILNSRRARGTSASPGAVQNGDALFVFQANGQTGPGSNGTGGQLVFEANQDWNTSAKGTRIMLQGVSDNSTALSEWMRLENSDVGIGKSPAEKLDVAGTVQMTGFKMPTGASNGYVLMSDANGVGTWQLSGGGGGWADDGTVVRLQTSADRVGIGMTSPSGKLHVQSSDASMPDQSGVVHSEFTGSAPSLAKAVYGKSRPGDNKGIGGHFEGGNTGVFGIVYPTGSISYWGVTGIVNGGSGQCYGVKGQAWNGSGGTKYGVYGSADDGSTNYGVYGTHTGTGYGVYYSGGLAGSGSKSCVVKTSRGPTLLYCQESPENWFEDFGQGQLSSGRTHIELDPLFLETITIDDSNPMKVFVQLEGDCNGVYVSKGTTGFDVLELKNGTSNVPFSYRVVAKRKGFEDKRLEYTQTGEADPYLYPEAAAKLEKERLEKPTAEE